MHMEAGQNRRLIAIAANNRFAANRTGQQESTDESREAYGASRFIPPLSVRKLNSLIQEISSVFSTLITVVISGSVPCHNKKECAACPTSIPSPSAR